MRSMRANTYIGLQYDVLVEEQGHMILMRTMVNQPITDINMKPTEDVLLLLPLDNLITGIFYTQF